MGYVPPLRPPEPDLNLIDGYSGRITDPTVVTEGLWRHPRLGTASLFGGEPPVAATGYQRYLHDLYGRQRADYLPVLGFLLLWLLVLLPVCIVWAVQ